MQQPPRAEQRAGSKPWLAEYDSVINHRNSYEGIYGLRPRRGLIDDDEGLLISMHDSRTVAVIYELMRI